MLGYECVLDADSILNLVKFFFGLMVAGFVIGLFSFIARFTGETRGTEDAIMAGVIIAGIGAVLMVVAIVVASVSTAYRKVEGRG